MTDGRNQGDVDVEGSESTKERLERLVLKSKLVKIVLMILVGIGSLVTTVLQVMMLLRVI